jgi:hypothetical protein
MENQNNRFRSRALPIIKDVRFGSESEELRVSISSLLHPPRADMKRTCRIGRLGPHPDSCTAAKNCTLVVEQIDKAQRPPTEAEGVCQNWARPLM